MVSSPSVDNPCFCLRNCKNSRQNRFMTKWKNRMFWIKKRWSKRIIWNFGKKMIISRANTYLMNWWTCLMNWRCGWSCHTILPHILHQLLTLGLAERNRWLGFNCLDLVCWRIERRFGSYKLETRGESMNLAAFIQWYVLLYQNDYM